MERDGTDEAQSIKYLDGVHITVKHLDGIRILTVFILSTANAKVILQGVDSRQRFFEGKAVSKVDLHRHTPNAYRGTYRDVDCSRTIRVSYIFVRKYTRCIQETCTGCFHEYRKLAK